MRLCTIRALNNLPEQRNLSVLKETDSSLDWWPRNQASFLSKNKNSNKNIRTFLVEINIHKGGCENTLLVKSVFSWHLGSALGFDSCQGARIIPLN